MKNVFVGLLGAALVAGIDTAAQAQISFGPRIGANFADFGYRTEGFGLPNTQMRLGAQGGVAANISFGNLALQPAVLYSQKGYRYDLEDSDNNSTETYKESFRLNYVEIPLNLVYTSGETEGVQVFAGPYVGLALGGKQKIEGKTTTGNNSLSFEKERTVELVDKAGTDDTKVYYRSFDAGVTFGVGYKTGPVQAQIGYGLGLSNLAPNDKDNREPEDEALNRNLQLSFTYFFGE